MLSVFTYIDSLLIEKDICDRLIVSIKLPCICVRRRFLHVFGKSFLCLFMFFEFQRYHLLDKCGWYNWSKFTVRRRAFPH